MEVGQKISSVWSQRCAFDASSDDALAKTNGVAKACPGLTTTKSWSGFIMKSKAGQGDTTKVRT